MKKEDKSLEVIYRTEGKAKSRLLECPVIEMERINFLFESFVYL